MHQAARQLADDQRRLCTSLFNEPNPDQINLPFGFLLCEAFLPSSHPLDAFSLVSKAEACYYAACLKSLCHLSPTIGYTSGWLVLVEDANTLCESTLDEIVTTLTALDWHATATANFSLSSTGMLFLVIKVKAYA